jgi:hypothetical protein
MTNGLRRRFWPEAGLSVITALLFLLTLVKRDWIEALFGIDPDSHNGSVEFMIVGGLLVVAIALVSLASYEWRRAASTVA